MFYLSKKWYDKIEDILCDVEFIRKNKNIKYSNISSVFDIETSSFYIEKEKQSCMYCWVFGINGKCIRGRTWEEFLNVIDIIINFYYINLENRFVIYIHNLSFEFQFIKNLFDWENVFSIEERKPIYALTKKGIEFRCSYILSGYSLSILGKNLNKYKVEKLLGDLDYDLIRHSKTPLTDKEWGYVLNDGLVVMAHIQEEIERLGNINKIPYTKTGYVRNLFKEKCLKGSNKYSYSKLMKFLTINEDVYNQLKRGFIGGYTHGNHNHINKTVKNVYSLDFTSSYPYCFLSEKYPMTPFNEYVIKDKKDFLDKINKFACLFDITFYNLKSKIDFEHYISKSKCSYVEDYIIDNGRIVNATILQTTINENDYKIIEKCYEWDYIEVGNFKISQKAYLPKEFIEIILELYKKKTMLKNVIGYESEYMCSKEMLNSCYGMCVTDPCKDDIIYDNENGWYLNKGNVEELLSKYNTSISRCLYYAWGVWNISYARYNLWTGILECKNDYLYSDTDSLKITNYENHKIYFDNYNIESQNKIKKCLSFHNISYNKSTPKTKNGVIKLLGVWDYEGNYNYFKTLGAKRYIYYDNELHITIAGVNKKNGKEYLIYKYKTIDNIFKNFKDGLEFPSEYEDKNDLDEKGKPKIKNASGKLCHTYIDKYISGEIVDYLGNVSSYCEFSSVHLEKTSYVLSLDKLFIEYLLGKKGSELI
jgi:hypothetical protein